MRVLVVNAGSSSLKLSVMDDDELEVEREVTTPENETEEEEAIRDVVGRAGPLDAVGHRVVHGGTELVEPVRIDDAVVEKLRALTDLAPLHQPRSLKALELVGRLLPDTPSVACFDTAFHARIPPAAATYALPLEWRERWELRRFGFHGLSHAYASERVRELSGRSSDGAGRDGNSRVVTCHLGAGASLAAVEDGVSVDTTMGFTPLEGLVMATRSGTVDPGLILWLVDHVGLPASEVSSALESRSGLLGLAGTADMRAVLRAEAAGDVRARLAVEVYVHRVRAGVAAMAAAMNGLDTLVFTGGVGERSPDIRGRVAAGLSFLGVAIDPRANAAEPDAEIGIPAAAVRTFVVAAREDRQIARDVRRTLREGAAAGARA